MAKEVMVLTRMDGEKGWKVILLTRVQNERRLIGYTYLATIQAALEEISRIKLSLAFRGDA